MKKLPILAICDDVCTAVQHMAHRDDTIAMQALGETGGCFEKPTKDKEPCKDIDCPDILPLAYDDKHIADKSAMENTSPLIHPDAVGDKRYVMGTKMQMRGKGKSHKRETCAFHDLDNSKQGQYIKTMNQEALQVTRQFVISMTDTNL